MDSNKVYDAIISELKYQEMMEHVDDSHVVEDFPLSAGLEAIRYNLNLASENWYNEKSPYPNTMPYLRKVAAICVRMGEMYGMPTRMIIQPNDDIEYGDDMVRQ